MTPQEQFRLARLQGIGGSDIGSLLSNQIKVEYGCERSLWARLSGIPPDNPESETEPMTLGTLLEPWVARAYADLTGRQVESVGLKKHPAQASLQVHVDRLIHPAPGDQRTDDGVLEIKAVGREMMRKVQDDGLPIDYVCQLSHGMLCHELNWGAFAIATREDLLPLVAIEQAALLTGDPMPKIARRAKILHFEMPRSADICQAIEEYGPKFWATVGDAAKAPPRLDPEDPRCGRCVRRNWCQGAAVMEGIEPETHIPRRLDLSLLVDEYRNNMALLEQCLALVAETESKFKTALGKTTAVKVPVPTEKGIEWKNVIYRPRRGAERVDGRQMAVQYDWLRRSAIEAKLPGAGLVAPSAEYIKTGIQSRPLLLSALLPKKPKAPGEVPETDEE